jgi:hypothetical protein
LQSLFASAGVDPLSNPETTTTVAARKVGKLRMFAKRIVIPPVPKPDRAQA